MSGRVVHFELPYDDGDRMRSFYKAAFDWTLQEIPELEYTGVVTGPTGEQGMPSEPGFINGGFFARGTDEPRGPVLVVDVPDIDAALQRVGELGGAVATAKMTVGDMGFAAYFRDTEGNVVGLWQTAAGA
jgi:predicted enzyme related to lactoylglutathione lyase